MSAFAPIVSPLHCPWGEKALTGYVGDDREDWRTYDACALIADGFRVPEILVDQGDKDNFLTEQLKPELLREACAKAGIDLTLRLQAPDTTIAIISSRPSWPIMSPGTRRA